MTINNEDLDDFSTRSGMKFNPITTNINQLIIGTNQLHSWLNEGVYSTFYRLKAGNKVRVGMLVTNDPENQNQVVPAGANATVKDSNPTGIVVGVVSANPSDAEGKEDDKYWIPARVQNTSKLQLQTSKTVEGVYLQVDSASKTAPIGSWVYYVPAKNSYELLSAKVVAKANLLVGYTRTLVVGGNNGLPYYVQVNITNF